MRFLLFVALAASATSCTVAATDRAKCNDNGVCRQAFGLGYVCAEDGYCRFDGIPPRCTRTIPPNLLLPPQDAEEPDETILFTALFDESLATHRARHNAIALAIRQANDEGGLEGRQFGGVFCTIEEDPQFGPETRTEAAVQMAERTRDALGAVAFIGPASSGDTVAVFEALRGSDSFVISPSATSPVLSDIDNTEPSDANPGLLWRTAPPDSLQGRAIAADMRTLGDGRVELAQSVAVIFEEGVYGDSLSSVFQAEFSQLGGTSTPFSYASQSQRDDAITTVGTGAFDEVLFVSSQTSDVIDFTIAASTIAGYSTKRIFLPDSAANADFLAGGEPSLFPNIRGTRQAPRDVDRDVVFGAFVASYTAEYNEDPRDFSFTANAFDAAWLAIYGVAWANAGGSIDGRSIAAGLRNVSAGPNIDVRPSSWAQIQQEFAAGRGVDVSGASSELDFNEDTEELESDIETWVISGGELVGVRVWTPSN